jgi:hypothetical protein
VMPMTTIMKKMMIMMMTTMMMTTTTRRWSSRWCSTWWLMSGDWRWTIDARRLMLILISWRWYAQTWLVVSHSLPTIGVPEWQLWQ